MRGQILCMCALFVVLGGAAQTQQQGDDPIGQSFFAPELVIQHQEAIGLNGEQKDYFKAEIRQAQLKFTELQWKLQDEMENWFRSSGSRAWMNSGHWRNSRECWRRSAKSKKSK